MGTTVRTDCGHALTSKTKENETMKQKNKKTIKVVTVALFAVSSLCAMAESRFRDDDFQPTLAQRSGLAFLRIIGSPLSLFTEGIQSFNEYKEATGESNPINFVVGMAIAGPVVTCFEATGGVLELISFQQFKSFAYPWEVDENDPRMVETIRKNRERERLQKEKEPESDFIGEIIGAAAGAAAGAATEAAINGRHRSSSSSYVTGSGTSTSGYSSGSTNVRPRVRHSSCGGTGRCNICKGKGTVGAGKRCVCGGSGICRPCNGTGYGR